MVLRGVGTLKPGLIPHQYSRSCVHCRI